MIDFVGLCRAARTQPGTETHDRLWGAWFSLREWHFISVPSPHGPLPFSSYIDGQRSVLAFTTPGGANTHAMQIRIGPPMVLAPEAMMARMGQLKTYGVHGFLVDIGPDGFFTSLDILWTMFHRFRTTPPPPVTGPAPAPAPSSGPPPGSLEWYLALPAWHVMMTRDRGMPEFASQGSDLIAQVFSQPHGATVAMPPAYVLALLSDLELVKFVRFDNRVAFDLVDVSQTFASRRPAL